MGPSVRDVSGCGPQLAGGPEHAVAGLIADLHPVGRDAGVLQGFQHLRRMVGNVLGHLVQQILVCLPGLRNVLAGRVGEEVAVMEIDHQRHLRFRGAGGEFHDIVLAAPAAGRVHPYAETDGVDSLFFQDVQDIGLRPIAELERAAVLFHLRHPGDVGALGEGGRGDGLGRNYGIGLHGRDRIRSGTVAGGREKGGDGQDDSCAFHGFNSHRSVLLRGRSGRGGRPPRPNRRCRRRRGRPQGYRGP